MKFGKIVFSFFLFLLFAEIVFADKNNETAKIQKDLDNVKFKIAEIKKEKDSLLNQIYKIELKYEREYLKKNKLQLEIKALNSQIGIKQSEEKELINKIDKSKEKIKKILRVLYKQGSNKHIRVFLNTKNINRLFKNYKFFESLISFNNKEINSFRVDIKKLMVIKEDLSAKNKAKQTDKLEVERKILNLRQIKRNKLALIRRINNDKGKYTKLKDELEHEFLKFNNSLMGENKIKNIVSDSEMEELKGMFTWPINGKVITQFGKQKSTKFNTYIINTGIEIKPKTSQNKISTIYSGNIVFSDYWKGYGKMIVVQHSKHFLSFYGHCKEFLKKKGDSVNEGEKIAIIGDTGSANVKSLYFEIRKNMVAQNPIKWLKKK